MDTPRIQATVPYMVTVKNLVWIVGFGEGECLACIGNGCITDNSTDDNDATSMLGTRFLACG